MECGREKRNVNGKTEEWTTIKKKVALMTLTRLEHLSSLGKKKCLFMSCKIFYVQSKRHK